MKNPKQPTKGQYRKGQTSSQVIENLIQKRIEIEEKNHLTNDKLTKLREDTDKLLHPEKYPEKK
nr:hypothetical protein [Pedobacter panaciterrae]